MAISERNAESDAPQSKELGETSDAELLAEFTLDRDSVAFSTLVNRHYGMVLGVAKRMLGCPHAAEDVVQATFIVLAKKASQIRKRDSLASWLYGVAFRISARTARQRAKSTVSILDEDVMVSADPLEKLTAQCEQNSVLEELNRLPTKIRACMVLRYLEGKPNSQVAEEMSLSESAVEGRLKRGRNQLRFRLAKQGVGFAAAVALLETMRQEAVATVVPEAMIQAITAAATQPSSSSLEGTENEAIRLAEQEMTKMITSKIFSSVLATALAVGVVSTGWNLVGGAIAIAQGDGAQGNGTIVLATNNAQGTAKPRATPQFVAQAQPASAQQNPDGLRYRDVGYYSVDELTPSEVRIAGQLQKVIDFNFDETPLVEVCDFLKSELKIPIMIDEAALEAEGLDASGDTITSALAGIQLRNALDLTLKKIDLVALMHKEVLLITTQAAAEEMVVTRIYQSPKSWSLTQANLTEAILTSVAPNSWNEVGGPGSITSVTKGLVVSNSPRVHDEINKLFVKLEGLYEPGRRKPRVVAPAPVRKAQPTAPGSTAPSAGDDPFGN